MQRECVFFLYPSWSEVGASQRKRSAWWLFWCFLCALALFSTALIDVDLDVCEWRDREIGSVGGMGRDGNAQG